MWEIACITDKGTVSEKNDDRVLVNNNLISCGKYNETADDKCIVAICDGVGGEKYGNEAAEIVVNELAKIDIEQFDKESIPKYIEDINKKVILAQCIDFGHSRMATTVAGIVIRDNNFTVFNVGDTRVYRYIKPYISQISIDHSLYRENSIMGIQTADQCKHIITRYIGGNRTQAAIFDGTGKMGVNDIFILCSDGVWDAVSDIEFESILASQSSADDICRNIFSTAIVNDTKDNLSIAIVRRL